MLHSFVRNYLHITWSTKNRVRVFQSNSKIDLRNFIIGKSEEIQCPFLAINTQPEHLHILVDLPANLCLSDFVQKIKGASSHWINEQKLVQGKFWWQRGYGAFSVSASQLDVVKNYIRNQDEHHRRKSFEEEYNDWKRNYGFFDDWNFLLEDRLKLADLHWLVMIFPPGWSLALVFDLAQNEKNMLWVIMH